MTPFELLWYAENIRIDELEQFKKERDLAEYNAIFFNPDGVKEVRKGRMDEESLDNKDFEPNEEFEKIKENPLVQAIKNRYSSKPKEEAEIVRNKITGALNIT